MNESPIPTTAPRHRSIAQTLREELTADQLRAIYHKLQVGFTIAGDGQVAAYLTAMKHPVTDQPMYPPITAATLTKHRSQIGLVVCRRPRPKRVAAIPPPPPIATDYRPVPSLPVQPPLRSFPDSDETLAEIRDLLKENNRLLGHIDGWLINIDAYLLRLVNERLG